MIGSAGGYQYFEDFADEAIGLLRDVASSVANPEVALMLVHQRWNDASTGPAIIYYLRLLAATYLKTNEAEYAAFIADDAGVQGYCRDIELVDREIEHIGVDALTNVLLKPANLVLEVAYLDRTPGSDVNRYRFPGEANTQDAATLGPIIYLLFRPDHYDILYRDPPSRVALPSTSIPDGPISMQVHRVAGFSQNMELSTHTADLGGYATADLFSLGSYGLTMAAPMMPLASRPAPSAHVEQFFKTDGEDPWPAAGQHFQPQPTTHQQQPVPVVAPPTPSASMTSESVMVASPPVTSDTGLEPQPTMPLGASPGFSFRFSPVQLEYDESKSNFPESAFQATTKAFTNSVYNRAHFGNPSFHPEEWKPDDDSIEGRMGGKRKGRKDSS